MKPYKTLIADDETHARNAIKNIVQLMQLPVEILGEATGGEEALAMIEQLKPDLVFMDIQMPDLSGIEAVQRLRVHQPRIIFITASHDYAIQAFRLSAIDYLLKPIDPYALKSAVEKLSIYHSDFNNAQVQLLQQAIENLSSQPAKNSIAKLALPTAEGIHFIELKHITWIESLSGYCKFYIENEKPIVVSRNMKEYEDMLTHQNFFRAHQSCLVNLQHVKKYVKSDGGQLHLTDATIIDVARRRKDELTEALQQLNKFPLT